MGGFESDSALAGHKYIIKDSDDRSRSGIISTMLGSCHIEKLTDEGSQLAA